MEIKMEMDRDDDVKTTHLSPTHLKEFEAMKNVLSNLVDVVKQQGHIIQELQEREARRDEEIKIFKQQVNNLEGFIQYQPVGIRNNFARVDSNINDIKKDLCFLVQNKIEIAEIAEEPPDAKLLGDETPADQTGTVCTQGYQTSVTAEHEDAGQEKEDVKETQPSPTQVELAQFRNKLLNDFLDRKEAMEGPMEGVQHGASHDYNDAKGRLITVDNNITIDFGRSHYWFCQNRSCYSRMQWCHCISEGARLTLHREPHNYYDENAIAVFADNHQVGYVPREQAAELAPLMDAGYHIYLGPLQTSRKSFFVSRVTISRVILRYTGH